MGLQLLELLPRVGASSILQTLMEAFPIIAFPHLAHNDGGGMHNAAVAVRALQALHGQPSAHLLSSTPTPIGTSTDRAAQQFLAIHPRPWALNGSRVQLLICASPTRGFLASR